MDGDEQWSELDRHPGGAITALATAQIPDGSFTVFAGSSDGLRRSLDHGHTWTKLAGTEAMPLVTAVAPSPAHPRGHALHIGTINGCYRMLDTGPTYELALGDVRVHTVAVVPEAGTDHDENDRRSSVIFLGTEADGVVRSGDGGDSWEDANAGLLDLSVLAIAFSPLYARDRTGFAATTSGLYRTRNGGRAWRLIDLPGEEFAVQCLAISPSFAVDGLVVAGTEEQGLYRSTDGGSTWAHVEGLDAVSVNAVALSPDGKAMVAGTDGGAAVTLDGGATWRWDGGALGPSLSVCLLPSADGIVVVTGLLTKGIGISADAGMSWTFAPDPTA